MTSTSDITLAPPQSVGEPPVALPGRPQLYHIECSRCGAISVRDVAHDAVRIICSSCDRRLTIPTSLAGTCAACGTQTSYPHVLAGHSAACGSCGRPVTLGPVLGKAHSARHHHVTPRHAVPTTPHRHETRHVAFREGAERSLILIVAGLATLIFIVAVTIL